jgi:uncharacterized protein DUF5317
LDADSIESHKPRMTAADIALRRSGRLIRIQATEPRTSYSTSAMQRWYAIRDHPGSERLTVWLLLGTVVAVVLVVSLSRGSFSELAALRVRGFWLLALGLGMQAALEFVDLPKNEIETVGYGILMASYACILAFCVANVATAGFGVIAIGIAMNALVIGLNQGMPTKPIGNDAHGNRVYKTVAQTVKHRQTDDDDLLPVLDDRILLPKPADSLVSFGDLVISIGIGELVYFASRSKTRRPLIR